MSDMRIITGVSSPVRLSGDGQYVAAQGTRDGAMFTQEWVMAKIFEGRAYMANSGAGTTPVTFAGAYDADAPDLFLHVPANVLVVPIGIVVKYEAVGTESELEVIGLASATGDSTATGTALTIVNMRLDAPLSSSCTATGSVDAAGITDPHAGNFVEFWRRGHPLKDTAATTENDRNEQVYLWSIGDVGFAPIVANGGSLSVYASSQAGTGFISLAWIELPTSSVS